MEVRDGGVRRLCGGGESFALLENPLDQTVSGLVSEQEVLCLVVHWAFSTKPFGFLKNISSVFFF